MANQILGTVYQVGNTVQLEPIEMLFSTQNIIVREAVLQDVPSVQSCISYYQSPGNSPTQYYVEESYSSLVSSANVGEVALITATIATSGQAFAFPSQNILILNTTGNIENANSCIQYRGLDYYVTETTAELSAQVNAGSYKVYTALLTQNNGSDLQIINTGTLTIGVTYKINVEDLDSLGMDFTNVGAPNNNLNTYFVATGTTPNSWGDGEGVVDILAYDLGAPVATVLENTIGNIWFTYNTTGNYTILSDGLFALNKTTVFGSQYNGDTAVYILFNTNSIISEEIIIRTGDPVSADSYLYKTPIEIRVYN